MQDLSLHLLDMIENSVSAKASLIDIFICFDEGKNLLSFDIIDDGFGMDKETLEKAQLPFYSTKKNKKTATGNGLPFIKEYVEKYNGIFSLASEKEKGTQVHVELYPAGCPVCNCSQRIHPFRNSRERIYPFRDSRERIHPFRSVHPFQIGKLDDVLGNCILGHPDIDFDIKLCRKTFSGEKKEFQLNTKSLKDDLNVRSMSYPELIKFLYKNLNDGVKITKLEEI